MAIRARCFMVCDSVTYWKQLQAVISWLELFLRVFQWLLKMDCSHRFLSGMFEQMLYLPIFGRGFSTATHVCLALSPSSHRVSTPSLAKAKPFHRLTLGLTSIPLVWLFCKCYWPKFLNKNLRASSPGTPGTPGELPSQASFSNATFFKLQAMNGLILSAVMKHSSNLIRLLIIACAMIVNTALSMAIFSLQLNLYFNIAFILVILALKLYHS